MWTSSKSRSSNAVLQMYFYLSWGDTWYNIEFHCFLIKKPERGFKGPSCPDTCLQREGHESLHQWGWFNTQKPTTKSVFIVFKNFTRPPGLLTLSSEGTRKSKLHQDQNNFHNLYKCSAHLFNVHIRTDKSLFFPIKKQKTERQWRIELNANIGCLTSLLWTMLLGGNMAWCHSNLWLTRLFW